MPFFTLFDFTAGQMDLTMELAFAGLYKLVKHHCSNVFLVFISLAKSKLLLCVHEEIAEKTILQLAAVGSK